MLINGELMYCEGPAWSPHVFGIWTTRLESVGKKRGQLCSDKKVFFILKM